MIDKKKIKRAIRRMVRLTGYDVSQVENAQDAFLHSHLAALFDKLGIECVIDVGANEGQFGDFLRDVVGFNGLIVSFEPIARHFEVLEARTRTDKSWIAFQLALGRESGTQKINVMESGDFSSFLTPNHAQVGEFTRDNVVKYTELTQVKTLDSMLGELLPRVALEHTYLKLDTQGYDLDVIGGAREAIKRLPMLQTEVSIRPIYEGMPSFRESYDTLTSMGFDITGLFPVTRDRQGRVVEFDCVMLRRVAV